MASHFAADTTRSGRKTGSHDARGRAPRPSRRGRTVAVVIGVIVALVLVVGGTVGFMFYRSAMGVRAEASELMAQASTLKESLKSGDAEALASSVQTISEKAAYIDAEVHTPLWGVVSAVPVIGEDVRSLQTLGSVATDLVDNALVPIANSVSGMSLSEIFSDGTVNIDLVTAVSESFTSAAPVIQRSMETISSLPEAHIPQVREVLERIQEPVAQVDDLVDSVLPLLQQLPEMLGADGARTYLIIAQNNAELRSTGGLPGSWGTLTVDNGVISLGSDFQTILHQPGFSVSATEEEISRICASIHTDPAQVNFTPNFVRVGELSQEYWEQAGYGTVDGVIAIDPVFLQSLLSLTGGFTAVDGTTVDGTNAAKVLLSDTYWKFGNDGEAQDAYFASVAADAFSHIMSNLGNAGLTDLWDTISQGAEQGRLLVWMSDDDEEALMEQMGFSGSLGSDPSAPELGVYINDDTISKISWYTSMHTEVGEGVENADGTTTYAVTTTLTNTITAEEASSAPTYISGGNSNKRDVTDMLDYVYFYAPAGGSISDMTVSEGGLVGDFPVTDTTAYGLQLVSAHVHARGGETVTFTYNVTVSAEASEPLSVRTTPLAQTSLM